MDICKINKIFKRHKIWLTSNGKNGGQIELAADLSYSKIVAADLRCASLNDSNLTHAKLSYTNLKGAELCFCNLKNADLRYANLSHANLYRAVLQSANLRGADLRGADLNAADLRGADLSNADLKGADLSNADLRGVNLRDVDLSCPKLHRTILPESTFIILGEKYFISIYGDYVRVGCEVDSASEWRQFSKQDIIDMGDDWLKFYPRLLDIIDFYCGKGERPEWLKAQNNDL